MTPVFFALFSLSFYLASGGGGEILTGNFLEPQSSRLLKRTSGGGHGGGGSSGGGSSGGGSSGGYNDGSSGGYSGGSSGGYSGGSSGGYSGDSSGGYSGGYSGGSSGSSSSSGSVSSLPSSSSSTSGGTEQRGGSGHYLNGGLGNQYSTGTMTSMRPYATQGSCCQYLCCSSGFRYGYAWWWYHGYRPTTEEQVDFQSDLGSVADDIKYFALINGTEFILTKECKLVVDNGMLVESSETLVEVNDSETLTVELLNLAERLDRLEDNLVAETEIDISEELRDWFLDFYALQPCLEALSKISEKHQERVFELRQEVEGVEFTVNAWEERLASRTGKAICMSCLKIITMIVSAVLVF